MILEFSEEDMTKTKTDKGFLSKMILRTLPRSKNAELKPKFRQTCPQTPPSLITITKAKHAQQLKEDDRGGQSFNILNDRL